METTLLFLAACLMFSGVHSISQSMSCSTVNGKTICNKQTSEGNSAMASSQARFGGDSSFQRTYAGAGGRNQWDSSSQTLNGGYPDGFYNPPPSYDYYDYQEYPGAFGGGPFTGVSNFASSGSPNFFTGSQAGGGAFAGGGPYFVPHYAFRSAGFPNAFSGSQAGARTVAGGPYVVPYYAFRSADSPNVFSDSQAGASDVASGGAPAQASSYAGPMLVPSNPFGFVRGFMGGGPAAGAFAGAGYFPFGRR